MNPVFLLFSLICLPFLSSCAEHQVHIVHFGEHDGSKAKQEIEDYHLSHLASVKGIEVEEARSSLLYSYKNSINAFAAVLTPDEASKFSEIDGVVSVIRSEPGKYSLQTTRSWKFVGLEEVRQPWNFWDRDRLEQGLWEKAEYGRGVVVGLLDSGVWPESKSFSDIEMGAIPKSWKGICQTGQEFDSCHCNRKLIGARFYLKGYEQYYGPLNTTIDYRSPRDVDGHGTHTASTVGGQKVPGASAFGGLAWGTAIGGAPLAHLAMYKVCWAIPDVTKQMENTCFEEDILAALDDAIGDGVDVLSLSLGINKPLPYSEDSLALGTFQAMRSGIVTVCAAGNSGPIRSTLSNTAPWVMTVAASSLDRAFVGPLMLGNGMLIEGRSVTPYSLNKFYPLAYAGDVTAPDVPGNIGDLCLPNSLSPQKVQGKIVMCALGGNGTSFDKGLEVRRAGGVGLIIIDTVMIEPDAPTPVNCLPTTKVAFDFGIPILNYIRSAENPEARIAPAETVIGTTPAPVMASFSSRGPNIVDPNILKPDITAPGLNILAAWSEGDSVSMSEIDPRTVEYNLDSGTSMAAPHVAAAAVLLKAVHPKWSSAAIRSALMTTATQVNTMNMPITEVTGNAANSFAYGSGHLVPQRAADPGLVYDAAFSDYQDYLCGLGVPVNNYSCLRTKTVSSDLNYPSLQISRLTGAVTVKRTVTNVGPNHEAVYISDVQEPRGAFITIEPMELSFDRIGQKRSFTITVTADYHMKSELDGEYGLGWYSWTDGVHNVNSPVAVSLG
ncbi:uncharacterized protein J3R85_018711 [Psidium guajava]|nr:uncharacterized protein J3R85_018711 [Psidium guajava]